MGTSIAMIDLHYGHLAVDSYQHAVSLLYALALERAVDAGWTSTRSPAKPHTDSVFRPRGSRSRRVVDVGVRSRREQRCQKGPIRRNFSEPSDGLEPSTPSLPWRCSTS
jgi:hypothetical protein